MIALGEACWSVESSMCMAYGNLGIMIEQRTRLDDVPGMGSDGVPDLTAC